MKIKIEREDLRILTLGSITYKVDAYYCRSLLPGHMYPLQKITQRDGKWILHFPEEQVEVTEISNLEEVPKINLRKCECSFLCTGWVYK